jgi:hypothetical protein
MRGEYDITDTPTVRHKLSLKKLLTNVGREPTVSVRCR